MSTLLSRIWRDHRLLLLLLVLALVVTLFFAVRSAVFWAHWSDPARRDQAIEGWMTPRYVAHSWQVPPELVFDAAGVQDGERRRETLAEVAARTGRSLDDIIAEIEQAIADARGAPR